MRIQCLAGIGAVAALSFSTPAFAQSPWAGNPTHSAVMKWEVGYLALSAIDTAQTIDCLDRGECKEGNPLFGKHPRAGRLIAAKVIFGAAHFALVRHLNERNPHAALRFVQGSVLMQGGIVALNARFAF
jgi:hypothetical protein